MIDPDSEKFPAKLQYRIFTSPAFLDLKPASKMILILMYYEIKFKKFGSKKKWLPLNEDNIVLPYKEIRHRIKYTDKTIWTSIQDLMAHGFINIRSYGGRAKGDFTIYIIKADWQNWEVGSVVYRSRTSKRVGFQTGVGVDSLYKRSSRVKSLNRVYRSNAGINRSSVVKPTAVVEYCLKKEAT